MISRGQVTYFLRGRGLFAVKGRERKEGREGGGDSSLWLL